MGMPIFVEERICLLCSVRRLSVIRVHVCMYVCHDWLSLSSARAIDVKLSSHAAVLQMTVSPRLQKAIGQGMLSPILTN